MYLSQEEVRLPRRWALLYVELGQRANSQDNKPAGGVAAPAGGKAPAGVPVWSSFMPPGGPVMGLPMGQQNRPLPQPQYAGNQLNMMMGAVPPPPPANVRQR
jgi:hypothetical protein